MRMPASLLLLLIVAAFLQGCGLGATGDAPRRLLDLTLSHPTHELFVGETQTLDASAIYSDTSSDKVTMSATWRSSDDTVAKVENGLVTALAKGEAVISAQFADKTAKLELFVHPKPVSMTISAPTTTIEAGSTVDLKATLLHDDDSQSIATAFASWVSSDNDVANVSIDGKVSGVNHGEATITATRSGLTAEIQITVTPRIARLEITKPPTEMESGQSIQLEVIAFYDNDTTKNVTEEVSWRLPITASQVAYVDAKGLLYGAAAGHVTVSAALKDKTASFTLDVTPELVPTVIRDSNGSIVLEWHHFDADTFTLFWDSKPGVTENSNRIDNLTDMRHRIDSLANGQTYYFRLATYKAQLQTKIGREVSVRLRHDRWTAPIVLTNAHHNPHVLNVNGDIVVYGGTYRDGSGKPVKQANSDVIDLASSSVHPLDFAVAPALDSASCTTGSVSYFIGGLDDTQTSISTITKYDTKAENYTTDLTTPRASSSCVVINNKIYVFGGYGQNQSDALDAVEIFNLSTNTSTAGATLPQALFATSALYIGDKAYVVGGRNSTGASKTLYEYDTVQNSWSAFVDMPSPRFHARVATINNDIIVVGGFDDTDNVATPNKEIIALNVATKEWTTVTRVRSDRTGYSIAVDNGQIYFIGGDNGAAIEKFDYFNKTWFPKTPMRTQAVQMAATKLDNDIYLVGGEGRTDPTANNTALASVEKYNHVNDIWTFVENAPAARAGASAVSYKKNIFVIGGMMGSEPSTRLDVYDTESNTWQQRADAPRAVTNATAYAIGDSIYVLGGDETQRSVQEYDINNDSWIVKKNTLIGRKNAATVAYEDYIYILGGITTGELSQNGAIRNTAYRYNAKGDFWETLPPLISARASASAFVVNGRIFVAGGKDDFAILGTAEVFNPHETSGRWVVGSNLNTPRFGAFGTAVDGIGYLVGGESKGEAIHRDIETLE